MKKMNMMDGDDEAAADNNASYSRWQDRTGQERRGEKRKGKERKESDDETVHRSTGVLPHKMPVR